MFVFYYLNLHSLVNWNMCFILVSGFVLDTCVLHLGLTFKHYETPHVKLANISTHMYDLDLGL